MCVGDTGVVMYEAKKVIYSFVVLQWVAIKVLNCKRW